MYVVSAQVLRRSIAAKKLPCDGNEWIDGAVGSRACQIGWNTPENKEHRYITQSLKRPMTFIVI